MAAMASATIRAGSSGFAYKPWKGAFYPEDLPDSEMLSYYAERLDAVEINNTFYRLPKASVLEGWAAQTPPGFRFAIKASRRITHFAISDQERIVENWMRSSSVSSSSHASSMHCVGVNMP